MSIVYNYGQKIHLIAIVDRYFDYRFPNQYLSTVLHYIDAPCNERIFHANELFYASYLLQSFFSETI